MLLSISVFIVTLRNCSCTLYLKHKSKLMSFSDEEDEISVEEDSEFFKDEEMEGKGSSQILALTWVHQRAHKLNPDRIQLSQVELKQLIDSSKSGIAEASSDSESMDDIEENDQVNKAPKPTNQDDSLDEFNMEDYDEEPDSIQAENMSSLAVFASNEEDPYITRKDEELLDEESEEEAIKLRDDDNMLACVNCEKDFASLQVFVYNRDAEDFYVHHDLPLSNIPLCLEWLDYDAGGALEEGAEDKGNFVALGNLNSVIEVWDLDVINTMEPAYSLGVPKREQEMHELAGEKNRGHTDAVLDLAWTSFARDKLGSASADRMVALWDLERGTTERKFKIHKEKVQTLAWKPDGINCLLSGAFDGRVIALDTRASSSGHIKWRFKGEIERAVWNSDDSNYFAAATDKGSIFYCDVRVPKKSLYGFTAHDGAIPCLSMTSQSLYSGGSDGWVKRWRLEAGRPELVEEKNMNMGMVHCFQVNPDFPDFFAIGGEKEGIRLWSADSSNANGDDVSPTSCNSSDGAGDNINETKEFTNTKEKKVKKVKRNLNDETGKEVDLNVNDTKEFTNTKEKKVKRNINDETGKEVDLNVNETTEFTNTKKKKLKKVKGNLNGETDKEVDLNVNDAKEFTNTKEKKVKKEKGKNLIDETGKEVDLNINDTKEFTNTKEKKVKKVKGNLNNETHTKVDLNVNGTKEFTNTKEKKVKKVKGNLNDETHTKVDLNVNDTKEFSNTKEKKVKKVKGNLNGEAHTKVDLNVNDTKESTNKKEKKVKKVKGNLNGEAHTKVDLNVNDTKESTNKKEKKVKKVKGNLNGEAHTKVDLNVNDAKEFTNTKENKVKVNFNGETTHTKVDLNVNDAKEFTNTKEKKVKGNINDETDTNVDLKVKKATLKSKKSSKRSAINDKENSITSSKDITVKTGPVERKLSKIENVRSTEDVNGKLKKTKATPVPIKSKSRETVLKTCIFDFASGFNDDLKQKISLTSDGLEENNVSSEGEAESGDEELREKRRRRRKRKNSSKEKTRLFPKQRRKLAKAENKKKKKNNRLNSTRRRKMAAKAENTS